MTYEEVLETVLMYMARERDTRLTKVFPKSLQVVEAKVNAMLRTMNMSSRVEYQVTEEELEEAEDTKSVFLVPPDFQGLREITVLDENRQSPVTLFPASNKQQNRFIQGFTEFNAQEDTKYVGMYTLVANKIRVQPPLTLGEILRITYYRQIPPLCEGKEANWLSSLYPDIYIKGVLSEFNKIVRDFEAANAYQVEFQSHLEGIKMIDRTDKASGTPGIASVDFYVP